MSNFNTYLKVGFPPLWAPTDQKAPLCPVQCPYPLNIYGSK